MKPKTIEQLIEEDKQDENLQRCRRVRDEISKEFKTVGALFAHLDKFEREHPKRDVKTKRTKLATVRKKPVPVSAGVSRKAV